MLNITVEGNPLVIKDTETAYTVFPDDPDEMPQEFESYCDAEEYGNERFGKGNYIIERA